MRSRTETTARCYFIAADGNAAVPAHFLALAHELAARGHRVVYLINGQRPGYEETRANPAIYVWPSSPPTRLRDARFLYRLIREYRPDSLMGMFSAVSLMMLVGWLAGVPSRIAWYRTTAAQVSHDAQLPGWKLRLLRLRKRLIYRWAVTHVLGNSRAVLHDLQQTFGIPAEKCTLFYNALADPLAGGQASPDPSNPHILCVGRLAPSKGQDVLIQAVALLCDRLPSLMVTFAGEGPAEAALKALARDLGVEQQCQFTGFLPHDQILDRMACCSVAVIVPSRDEAFGMVNIEALAVGRPVIASRVGGIPEVIEDGVDGFLVPPGDPAALAEKLYRLMTDATLRETLGRNAREHFIARFEREHSLAEQADWLEQTVAPRRARVPVKVRE